MNRTALVVLVSCLLLILPVVVAGALVDPHFETTVPEPTLTPGAEQTVTVELVNDARTLDDQARTAGDVTVEAAAGDTPFTILSGRQYLGALTDNERVPVSFRLLVPADTEPGTYRIPLQVRYTVGNDRERATVRATVQVIDRPRLRVVDADADVAVGERGTVSVTVENVGSATASDARLTLSSAGTDLSFAGATDASRFIGRLERGQRETVTYTVSATTDARSEQYALAATATYLDQNRLSVTQDLGVVGVTPQPELQFVVRDVESNLHTGVEGTLRGTVVNRGNKTARNAVVTLRSSSETLRFREPSYPIGDLEPGASRAFEFPVSVPSTADSGPRAVTIGVEYELDSDTADQRRQTDARVLSVPVDDSELLALSAINATYQPGTDGKLRVQVKNVGDERLTEIEPRLAATAPFSSQAPQTYVESLAPGASTTVTFQLNVSRAATENSYSLPINVTASTADGDAVTTGPHDVAVSVRDRDQFAVRGVNTTVPPDAETQIRVRIENVGDRTLRDIKPRISPSEPFSSQAPQTYVESLAPGESVTVTFQVTVADDAVPSTHSLPVVITATDPDDDTIREGPHDVAVEIAVEEGTAGSAVVLVVGIVVVAVVLGVGWWWLRR